MLELFAAQGLRGLPGALQGGGGFSDAQKLPRGLPGPARGFQASQPRGQQLGAPCQGQGATGGASDFEGVRRCKACDFGFRVFPSRKISRNIEKGFGHQVWAERASHVRERARRGSIRPLSIGSSHCHTQCGCNGCRTSSVSDHPRNGWE